MARSRDPSWEALGPHATAGSSCPGSSQDPQPSVSACPESSGSQSSPAPAAHHDMRGWPSARVRSLPTLSRAKSSAALRTPSGGGERTGSANGEALRATPASRAVPSTRRGCAAVNGSDSGAEATSAVSSLRLCAPSGWSDDDSDGGDGAVDSRPPSLVVRDAWQPSPAAQTVVRRMAGTPPLPSALEEDMRRLEREMNEQLQVGRGVLCAPVFGGAR